MMKKIFQSLLGAFTGYTGRALALWAEAGTQLMVPHFQSNSNYTGLVGTRYIFVQATAGYRANQAVNATSSAILGVMQNNPGIDEAMSIACAGVSKVVAGGAVTANAIITTNASGRAAAVTSGDIACGRALEAAGADGDVFTAMLFHPVRWSGA